MLVKFRSYLFNYIFFLPDLLFEHLAQKEEDKFWFTKFVWKTMLQWGSILFVFCSYVSPVCKSKTNQLYSATQHN